MTDRNAQDRGSTETTQGAPGHAPPLIRRSCSLPADLDYRLRVTSARRGWKEAALVREALAAHLGVGLEPAPRKPFSLPWEMVEVLSELAASRGLTPDELAAALLAEALDEAGESSGSPEGGDRQGHRGAG